MQDIYELYSPKKKIYIYTYKNHLLQKKQLKYYYHLYKKQNLLVFAGIHERKEVLKVLH